MCMTQMVLGEGKALVGGLALVRSRIEAVCGYQRQVDIIMPWQDPPSVTRALVLGICIKKSVSLSIKHQASYPSPLLSLSAIEFKERGQPFEIPDHTRSFCFYPGQQNQRLLALASHHPLHTQLPEGYLYLYELIWTSKIGPPLLEFRTSSNDAPTSPTSFASDYQF